MRIIILRHECRKLENRLWNWLYIRAYGFEKKAEVTDLTRLEFVPVLGWMHRLVVTLYIRLLHKTIVWTPYKPLYLPPSGIPPEKFARALAQDTVYLAGWAFYNPAGLTKYRTKLLEEMLNSRGKAYSNILENIGISQSTIETDNAKSTDKKCIIGVYVQQKPLPYFPKGEFLVPLSRMGEIIEEYMREKNLAASEVFLAIVSDSSIPSNFVPQEIAHQTFQENYEGLWALSQASVVIGLNSNYAKLGAWMGNIPYIVATNAPVDWPYYQGKNEFFENKYATGVLGLMEVD